MRYDLKKPCKNCPFGKGPDRIVFADRERAEEIENSAYRMGFPCHLSADLVEFGDCEDGYVAGPNTQHCAGASAMFLSDGYDSWPGIDNDEDRAERIRANLIEGGGFDMAFDCVEDFLDANQARER